MRRALQGFSTLAAVVVPYLLAGALALPALAEDARVSREREALRRAQAALGEARQNEQSLEAEKAALLRDNDQLKGDAQRAAAATEQLQERLRNAERQARGARDERRTQREREGVERTAAAADSRAHDDTARRQVAELQREVADRSQTVAAIGQLLERAIAAVADAETKNRQLHALGTEAVRRWQTKTCAESQSQADPVLGFTAVRIENEAEALRALLDAQRSQAK